MSLYSEFELSLFGGKPIELYKFVHGADVWTYCAVSKDVVYDTETYAQLPIGRTSIGQNNEMAKSDITITCPIGCEVSQLFLTGSPENAVSVTIFRQHDGAEDGPVVAWKGRVVSAKWDGAKCKLVCGSIYSTQKRIGLRARYTRNCRHILYSRGCNLNKDDFAIPATVSAIDGSLTVLTVPAAAGYSAGYFLAGMIGADGVYRFIINHSGSSITLATPITSVAVDDTINLYPGCDHSLATCKNKFNNLANNGSFAWIPIRNPFEGSVV